MSALVRSTPIWRRTLAWSVDYFVVALYMAALFFCFFLLDPRNVDRDGLFASAERAQISSFLLLTLPVVLYAAITESSAQRGTLGKQVTGLVVETAAGARLTLARSLLRSTLKFAPWELAHTFIHRASRVHWEMDWVPAWAKACLWISLGLTAIYITGTMTGSRRPLYDLIAGTQVSLRMPTAPSRPRLQSAV